MRRQKNRVKTPMALLGILFLAIFTVSISQAQQMRTIKLESEDEILMLEEIGGILLNSDEGIKVEMAIPADQRPEKFKTVNIKTGDIIKMLNGKSVKNVADLKAVYDISKPGDEFKFGIKRDKEMLIARLVRATPDELPNLKIRTAAADDNNPYAATLVGNGLMLKEAKGRIFIDDVLPELAKSLGDNIPAVGDEILTIQGKRIESLEMLSNVYEKIKLGDKVTLTFKTESEEYTIIINKMNQQGLQKKIIKKD